MGLKKQTKGETTDMEKEVERKYRKEFITIYFSNGFSIMKNSSFMDHIADAEQILFDKTLHCKCDSIEKAEDFVSSVRNLHLGSNIVSKVLRLGPAFLAMRNNRYKNMKNVLVIRDLPVHSSDFINNTFPTAVDICLKKKMAVVFFENEDSANLAYVTFQSMDFPPQIHPKVDRMIAKGASLPQDEDFDDPNVMVHGHPNKLVSNPTVVCVQLQRFFDLKSQMKLLEKLRTAEDIMLSRSCSLSFGAGVDVWERRKLLEGLDVDGERVVVWVRGRGGKRPILSPLIFNSTPIPASSFRPISVPPNHSTPTSGYPDHGPHPMSQVTHQMFGGRGSESLIASYFSESRQYNTDVKMTLSRITDQMSDLQLKLCELQSSDKLRGGNSAAAIGFYAKVEDSLKQIGKISEQESSKQSSSTSLREDSSNSGDLSVLFYQIKQLQQSLEEDSADRDTSVRSIPEVVRFMEGLVTKSYKGQLRIVTGRGSSDKGSDELEVLKRKHQSEIAELTNQLREVKGEQKDLMNGKEDDRYYAEECLKMHRNLFGEESDSQSHWFDNYTALHKAYTSTINLNQVDITEKAVTNDNTEKSSPSILVANLCKEIDALKEQNELLQSENSKLCTLAKDCESQKESVVNERQRVITLSATNERLETELKEQMASVENLETLATSSNSKKVEELQGLVAELNKMVSDKNSELSCLTRKVQEKDAELVQVRDVRHREIKEKDEALAELNESRAEVETELMEISGAQQSMEKEVEFLRQQLRRLLSLRKNESAKTEQSIQTHPSAPVDDVSAALRKVMNAVFKECRGHFHDSTDFNGGNVKSFLLNTFRVYTIQYVDSLKKSQDLSRSSNGFENHDSTLDESKNASFPIKENCTISDSHDNEESNKNDTREDSLAENRAQEDFSAENGAHEDLSAESENRQDSPAKSENRQDSPAKSENRQDSPAKSENWQDSPAKSENWQDSAAKSENRQDSPAKSENRQDSPAESEDREDIPVKDGPREDCNENTTLDISPTKQNPDLVTYQNTSPDKFTESVLDNLSSPSQSIESSRNFPSSNRTSSCEDFSSGDMTVSLPSDMNKIHGSVETVSGMPPLPSTLSLAPTITHATSEPFIESNSNDSSVDSTKSSKKENTREEQAKWPTLMEAQPPPLPLFSDDEEDDWIC